jgi:hypothetical protein
MRLLGYLSKVGTALALMISLAMPAQAQNNLVLFGNRDNVLGYRTRTSRPRAALNFYTFYVPLPRNKAVAELQIIYPNGMASIFNPDRLEIRDRRSGKVYSTMERIVDEQVGSVRLVLSEPIPSQAGQELEITAEGVTNPPSGMYRVRVSVMGTEANPLFFSVGQWLVSIY